MMMKSKSRLSEFDLDTIAGRLAYKAEDFTRRAGAELTKFKERFEKEPAYAFEWSNETFAAAARFELGTNVKKWLTPGPDNKATPEGTLEYLKRELMSKAKWSARSTSVPSNEIDARRREALAEMVEFVEGEAAWR